MPDASDFPFDASKYAFRTDFDGLTASDDGSKARVDKAAATFKTALTNFESDDKSAREEYDSYKKEDGVPQIEFKDFVDKYVSLSGSGSNQPCWSNIYIYIYIFSDSLKPYI